MKVSIVGAGLIGNKRAKYLKEMGIDIDFVADINHNSAFELTRKYGGIPIGNFETILNENNDDFVIVATPNVFLYPISLALINKGNNVFIEKPGAINSEQIFALLKAKNINNVKVQIGYNHIFHPAFQEALDKIKEIGNIMYIDAHYGHGGAYLFSNGWRTDPINHAGDLSDKGCHLINLCSWFLNGNFSKIYGTVKTYYWNHPVDDNSFFILETTEGQIAHLHTSCTNWRNDFYFGIFGTKGKLEIKGLNGSYGVESLTKTLLIENEIKPSVEIKEYLGDDKSWKLEMEEFVKYLNSNYCGCHSLEECLGYMNVIEDIYGQNGINYDTGS
jgi:predicted dehydrogenase